MKLTGSSPHPEKDEFTEEEPLTPILDVVGIQAPEPVTDLELPNPENKHPIGRAYEAWQMDPSQDNLYQVTSALRPTINSVLASIGGASNPHLAARARVVTAKAIQTFDPNAGVGLPTWVSNQLRQLSRDVRKSNNVMSVPEGVQLDAYTLYRKEMEFQDEHGREPSVAELADAAGMSVKRINTVREKFKPVASESSYNVEGANLVEGASADFSKDAIDYVYHDSDLTDQKLIEHTMGYGGADIMDNKTLMQKLKLTPVQLTRRRARLGMRVKEIVHLFDKQ